ncbi:MAG: ABC transporter permease subunit [Coriobacteriia bacterium]|nr:ABC transporter permease subunit [Coriobacteriia bacterium]MCL2606172.1 ABC transporter permease subunit [Coriobacteriia bacterium]
MKLRLKKIIGYIGATIAILLGWALLALLIDNPALPQPVISLAQLYYSFPDMLPHLGISLWRILAAMFIGITGGAILGLLVGRSPRADLVAAPLLYVLYPVPKVVFVPVLLVLMGLGSAPAITLIAIVIFFQTMVTARDSAKSISPDLVLSVRSLGASKLDIARHVVIPYTLPNIFTALRISAGTAIAVLFLTESIAGNTGIGFYVINEWGRMNFPAMFAGIIAMALMGVIMYEAINLAERRFIRWKSTAE